MVRATFAGFTTALSALQANQKRLDITGQNLANMNTVGYTRQQLDVSSLNFTKPTGHYSSDPMANVGFGVAMTGVSQIRDPYLDIQYRLQMSKSSYSDSMQTSLDSLAAILDETNVSGIRQAFDDIQSTLTSMQDPAKVNDPIYESELRTRMQQLTNLLNSSSKDISQAIKNEYTKLDGTGSSENGYVDEVNDILRQIGDLNRQIKTNELVGQSALELKDERNVLLDELAGYLPIEVTYYKDEAHDGIDANGQTDTDDAKSEIYDLDKNGNIIGKKEWPDDLRVELVYTDGNNVTQKITLINGTEGKGSENYGSLKVQADQDDPTKASVSFTGAGKTTPDCSFGYDSASGKPSTNQLSGGSIASSLDMLVQDGTGTSVRGYQYYMNKLDTLARTFAEVINKCNTDHKGDALLTAQPNGGNITAANIGLSSDWVAGNIHIASDGDSTNGAILDMLASMKNTHTDLDNNSFADFANHVSTILANDSYNNTNSLKTNVTVLNGIQNSRDSLSGVSLDEEASNMMSYISAYNAASRLMTTLDEALDTLINGTGVVGR